MSRTQKSGTAASPVQKYLSFKGSTGQLKYYDKDSTEEDKNVYLDSLEFTVLDTKAAISGFNENENCGINSNLLDQYDLAKKEFIVKTKTNGTFGEFARGFYKEIKDKVFAIGGKFTTCIFAIADLGNGLEVIRLDLQGSSLGPWIELVANLPAGDDIYSYTFTIKKGALCGRKAGANYKVSKAEYNKVLKTLKDNPMAPKPVWFYESDFELASVAEGVASLAEEKDTELQEYFKGADAADIENPPVDKGSNVSDEEPDDLPF